MDTKGGANLGVGVAKRDTIDLFDGVTNLQHAVCCEVRKEHGGHSGQRLSKEASLQPQPGTAGRFDDLRVVADHHHAARRHVQSRAGVRERGRCRLRLQARRLDRVVEWREG